MFNWNILRRQNVTISRLERIRREGSPPYVWIVPVTAATASSAISVEKQFPAAMSYKPIDWIECVNNGLQDLTMTINGDEFYKVPAGTIRTVDIIGIWHVNITNNGGAVTVLGKVVVTVQKQAQTIDKWAREH